PPPPFRRRPLVEAALKAWTAARLAVAMAELADATLDSRRRPALADTIAERALLAIAVGARRGAAPTGQRISFDPRAFVFECGGDPNVCVARRRLLHAEAHGGNNQSRHRDRWHCLEYSGPDLRAEGAERELVLLARDISARHLRAAAHPSDAG